MSKAWLAIDDDQGEAVLVTADTRGQARASAASELNLSFKEVIDYVSVTRFPVLDDKGIATLEGLRYGAYHWFECRGCGKHVGWEGDAETGRLVVIGSDDVPIAERGGWDVFCSLRCRDAWVDEWKDKPSMKRWFELREQFAWDRIAAGAGAAGEQER